MRLDCQEGLPSASYVCANKPPPEVEETLPSQFGVETSKEGKEEEPGMGAAR